MWAIGTGQMATPEQAQEVHAFIRKRVARCPRRAAAAAVRILYGGSVKPDNVAGLLALADVDGALVGGRVAGRRLLPEDRPRPRLEGRPRVVYTRRFRRRGAERESKGRRDDRGATSGGAGVRRTPN